MVIIYRHTKMMVDLLAWEMDSIGNKY